MERTRKQRLTPLPTKPLADKLFVFVSSRFVIAVPSRNTVCRAIEFSASRRKHTARMTVRRPGYSMRRRVCKPRLFRFRTNRVSAPKRPAASIGYGCSALRQPRTSARAKSYYPPFVDECVAAVAASIPICRGSIPSNVSNHGLDDSAVRLNHPVRRAPLVLP
jgi:hypothetical protein